MHLLKKKKKKKNNNIENAAYKIVLFPSGNALLSNK
jgi:hypothetical protein